MTQHTHRFRCPCCHKQLELETATGKVREVDQRKEVKTRAKKELDTLLDKQDRENERLGDAFSRAADDALSQADKFDDLFNSALDDAKKDKDKKPHSPFDLD